MKVLALIAVLLLPQGLADHYSTTTTSSSSKRVDLPTDLEKNRFYGGCDNVVGYLSYLRRSSKRYKVKEIAATCNTHYNGEVVAFVVGIDGNCGDDLIEKCDVDGSTVSCDLYIAPKSKCHDGYVDAKLHVFCC